MRASPLEASTLRERARLAQRLCLLKRRSLPTAEPAIRNANRYRPARAAVYPSWAKTQAAFCLARTPSLPNQATSKGMDRPDERNKSRPALLERPHHRKLPHILFAP